MDYNLSDKFIIMGMTPPDISVDEPDRIAAMLDSGIVDYMHIRHPEASRHLMESVLEAIPERLHPRVRIHSHFDLLERYSLAGPHLSSRWAQCSVKGVQSVTKSCHRLFELWNTQTLDYVTLSPIYTDKRKYGHIGEYNRNSLMRSLRGRRVVALGGVAPDKFAELKQAGFYGAGMLGYLWQREYMRSLRQIKMHAADGIYLQYITDGSTPEEIVREVQPVLEGGCRWIQIRMKGADDATVAKAVEAIAPMCHASGAMMIIDDRVELAARLDVDGVHIGRQDMVPDNARRLLGELKIIGCTANTLEDIVDIDRYGVADYVGLGPFGPTTSKTTPVIGYERLIQIFDRMHERQLDVPVVVMGGVKLKDVNPIMSLGARGIAVSTCIRTAADPKHMTELMVEKTYEQG